MPITEPKKSGEQRGKLDTLVRFSPLRSYVVAVINIVFLITTENETFAIVGCIFGWLPCVFIKPNATGELPNIGK